MSAGPIGRAAWRLPAPPGDKTFGYFTGGLGYSKPMKVAAYQAPLLAAGSLEAIDLIEERVAWCESEGVSILCCPEAVLGGLADYTEYPARFAMRTDDGQLARDLTPLTSDSVTSIIGFTELADNGRLYNAAAVFHRGRVAGLYRKLHPAIRWSVYSAGSATPVFQVGELTFGIVICHDSTFPEPARLWDVTADGQRFLTAGQVGAGSAGSQQIESITGSRLDVVVNWQARANK